MSKKRKKRKLKIGRILLLLIILIIILLGVVYLVKGTKKLIIKNELVYLASTQSNIELYTLDENKELKKDKEIQRGIKVKSNNKKIDNNEKEYTEIEYEDNKYYVESNNITKDKKSVVKEKEKYVRTSVTVYKNEKDSKIESFIKKGNHLDILGYDILNEDGTVNMYKIKKDDIEGWVYSKYLVDTEETAKEVYNENGIFDKHKGRKFVGRELHGGKTETLDYYPYQKEEFKDNPLMKNARTMYLNGGVIKDIDKYLKIATENKVNAIVVDIKDGALAYSSNVAKEMSPTAYETAINDNEEYKNAIKKIKDAGIYAIGRIVVFNDVHYGKDHPEDCITSTASSRLWPSAFSRGAWEYNVELAKEAVREMGFNEIQFDYVRFPEDAYNMSISGNSDFKNKYDEEKAEAVQNFLFYAVDQIHKEGAYLSVDVFGECSSGYVTAYGQYWPAISNIVDAISSMPYTDHFGSAVDTWSNPYQTVYNWAKTAAIRQTEIPTPAVARTWITAYDTPHWNPKVIYGAEKISDQVKALYDAGLNGGFITWNSSSSLSKYEQIKSAFAKEYE